MQVTPLAPSTPITTDRDDFLTHAGAELTLNEAVFFIFSVINDDIVATDIGDLRVIYSEYGWVDARIHTIQISVKM